MRAWALSVALAVIAITPGTRAQTGEPARQGGPRPEAADLAARLQARYETVLDFTARFTQTYESGLLRMASSAPERGELKLKKPNRFRMVYLAPERKEFVADGRTLKSYFPADRVGSEHRLPDPGEATSALMFIAGRGHLVRDFTAFMPAAQPDGEWQLTLTPRTPQDDFETLTLQVDRRTLQLTGFGWTETTGGRSTIRLSNLRENTNLRETEFAFEFPKGTVFQRQ